MSIELRPIEELSAEDGRRLFDAAAERLLGLSGTEFLRRWDAGQFTSDDRSEVTHVAMLIPLGR